MGVCGYVGVCAVCVGLCGYVWVKVLALSPRRVDVKSCMQEG